MLRTRAVRLEDIASVNPRLSQKIDPSTLVSFVGMADLSADRAVTEAADARPYGDVAKGYTAFQDGDLLVAKITPCFENGKIGQARLSHRLGFGSTEFHVVRPHPELADARFLMHFLRSPRFRAEGEMRMTGSGGQRRVPVDYINQAPLHLPPLDEQRRIAAILDKADELLTKRRQALAQLEVLTQSIFHSMFGDPYASERWPDFALDDLLSAIESGQSPVCEDRPAEADEWGVLKLSAVTKLTFDDTQNKALTSVAPNKQHEVRQGDLLFSRKNTRALVAAVALVGEVRPRLLLSDLIFRLCIRNHGVITPQYLHAVMAEPTKRAQIQNLAGGSSGSMPNISKAKLLTVKIPTPPIELQQEFGRRVSAIERLKGRQRHQLAELEVLFASLQNRSFSGEL
ncbi:restriction endonuclease subunit S [Arthrobacter pascens]|uniref:restriction endonuclease subunit S n=1 Tax=Arthrobacter pascens TaxID=1677 RepID=UPI00286ACC32|nr:restriction endonuclease subunit S [Arthrobacter pascens]